MLSDIQYAMSSYFIRKNGTKLIFYIKKYQIIILSHGNKIYKYVNITQKSKSKHLQVQYNVLSAFQKCFHDKKGGKSYMLFKNVQIIIQSHGNKICKSASITKLSRPHQYKNVLKKCFHEKRWDICQQLFFQGGNGFLVQRLVPDFTLMC